ncbi:MAG TPA: branched-chain amino acid ABC transporter substrate-binding protein [Anaerolineae bacterium]|nr:branched-chain amino acid ABC transporter substrate-binding protein [Anaerolineae bacterium]
MSRWPVQVSRVALALIMMLTVLLAACQPTGSSVVRVYASFPLRGPKIGGGIVKGIQLAFDGIASHIGKTEVELVILDNGDKNGQWQAELELVNVQQAINDSLTVAYLGPMNSGAAKISLPLTNRAGLVQISPSTTWPGLTKPGFAQGEPAIFYPTGQRNFFRTCSTDDVQGPVAASWARDLKFRSFYVLDDGEAYGAGVAALFARRAEQLGLTNVGHQTIDKTSKDFKAVLTEVKQARPDVVYFGGTVASGAALIVQQMRALGIVAAFMGPDAIVDTSLIDLAGPDADGVYATFVGAPPDQLTSEMGQSFYAAFKQQYNEEPEAFAQFGYDAAQVVIAAMQRASVIDRASLLADVRSGQEFQGTVGTFKFDRNGDTSVTLVSGSRVQNGVFKFSKVLTDRQ